MCYPKKTSRKSKIIHTQLRFQAAQDQHHSFFLKFTAQASAENKTKLQKNYHKAIHKLRIQTRATNEILVYVTVAFHHERFGFNYSDLRLDSRLRQLGDQRNSANPDSASTPRKETIVSSSPGFRRLVRCGWWRLLWRWRPNRFARPWPSKSHTPARAGRRRGGD